MVDNCRHVNRITPSADHSILNPQKWLCCICGTTESVWACLSCSHVACGRYIEEHALKHYKETKHPISLEVNDKYAYCYECGDYILNDNAAGDLKILRNALSAVALQSFDGLEKRGRRILRSQSFCSLDTGCERRLREQDRNTTILWFRRYYLIAKMFNAWKQSTSKIRKKLEKQQAKLKTQQEKANAKQMELHGAGGDTYHPASSVRKGPFIPGVTGLRNLGNTCYMNSVLQVLSHMRKFRQIFLESPDNEALAPSVSPTTTASSVAVKNHSNNSHRKSSKYFVRQTTMECFQHVSESGMKRTGLNGGASTTAKKLKLSTSQVPSPDLNTVSLCRELHALLRVMWSGKWALVSPHKMLSAVWKTIPFFKGYSQQDAQEFLCEFLDKLSSELEKNHMYSLSTSLSVTPSLPSSPLPTHSPHTPPNLATKMRDIVTNMFHGELVSELTCTKCGTKSLRTEPFTDLSLEFPDRYHYRGPGQKISYENVHVEEMLRKFTEKERLEGKVYSCEKCNNHRRRSVAKKPTVYTQVEKQFMVQTLPHVLRLHLKRFMWGGRNHRGKISVHVDFSTELDMRRYCHETTQAASFLYNLNAVVMHHGRGFGSGHYTSYCWNEDADSWIHCNDAKLEKISVNDVMKVQAYILFYTQKTSAPLLQELSVKELPLFDEKADDDVTFNYQNSAIPKYVELKRRLSEDHSGRMALKKRRTTSW